MSVVVFVVLETVARADETARCDHLGVGVQQGVAGRDADQPTALLACVALSY